MQTCELLSQQRQLQIIAGEKGERGNCVVERERREVGDSRFCHKNCRTGREGRKADSAKRKVAKVE